MAKTAGSARSSRSPAPRPPCLRRRKGTRRCGRTAAQLVATIAECGPWALRRRPPQHAGNHPEGRDSWRACVKRA
eukprot:4837035-Lingulodinium_polyedra.AAC.1